MNMSIASGVAAVMYLVCGTGVCSAQETVAGLIAEMRKNTKDPEALGKAIEQVRTSGSVYDKNAIVEVAAFGSDADVPYEAREAIVKEAVRHVGGHDAFALLRAAATWARDWNRLPGGAGLAGIVMEQVASSQWRNEVVNSRELLECSEAVLVGGHQPTKVWLAAIELWNSSTRSTPELSASAEHILLGTLGDEWVDGRIVARLIPESVARLRESVRASNEPSEFPYSIAAALMQAGDREGVALLRQKEKQFEGIRPRTSNIIAAVRLRGEIQQSPESMLAFIRGATDIYAGTTRTWAIRRALNMGLPKEQVREAALAYFDVALAAANAGDQRAGAAAQSVRRAALDAGVISDTEHVEFRITESVSQHQE